LDILGSYGDRIDLLSEPDRGPADAFWRALSRCKGEIVGTCLSDEELMPDAIEKVVRVFTERPWIGAIIGDAFHIDREGNIIGKHTGAPFNILDYVSAEYCPYWSSSFFSMSALRDVGVLDRRWSDDSIEFEIWCRLASDYEIVYYAETLSKYGIHPNQLSQQSQRALKELDERIRMIRDRLFTAAGFFGKNDQLRDICILRQHTNLIRHFVAYKSQDARLFHERLRQTKLLDDFDDWNRDQINGSFKAGTGPIPIPKVPKTREQKWASIYRALVPELVRSRVPLTLKTYLLQLIMASR
jgi:hypothetical protein